MNSLFYLHQRIFELKEDRFRQHYYALLGISGEKENKTSESTLEQFRFSLKFLKKRFSILIRMILSEGFVRLSRNERQSLEIDICFFSLIFMHHSNMIKTISFPPIPLDHLLTRSQILN
jgi:hypothetical protein